MATFPRMSITTVCVLFILALFIVNSRGLVHDLHTGNIDKFLRGKLFTLTFIDSPSCTRCKSLYPYFVAASQVFPHDPEIFFTRTRDPNLITKWDISELPAFVYHKAGLKNHHRITVDVTVDDIIDEIARIMHGNFGGLTKTYSVQVDEKNYDEVVVTPTQSVLMLIHDKDDALERSVLEQVAYTFRKDDGILLASLDIVKYKKLRDEKFMTEETPVMMWFAEKEKQFPKRFGGFLTQELLTQFISQETMLHRDTNGELTSEAGRIPEADEILRKDISTVFDGSPIQLKILVNSIEKVQEKLLSHQKEMLEYYLYLLENIAAAHNEMEAKDVLKEIEKRISSKEGLSTKQKENVNRKRNIIKHLQELGETYAKEKLKATEEVPKEDKRETSATDSDHIVHHEEL